MGHAAVEAAYRNLPLPHFIWVCEISIPSDYSAPEHRVWGEIVWDATRNSGEADGWLAVHYPEKLVIDIGTALNTAKNRQITALDKPKAYPVYENNLKPMKAP